MKRKTAEWKSEKKAEQAKIALIPKSALFRCVTPGEEDKKFEATEEKGVCVCVRTCV